MIYPLVSNPAALFCSCVFSIMLFCGVLCLRLYFFAAAFLAVLLYYKYNRTSNRREIDGDELTGERALILRLALHSMVLEGICKSTITVRGGFLGNRCRELTLPPLTLRRVHFAASLLAAKLVFVLRWFISQTFIKFI